MTKLTGLSYKIHYKKGTENNVADALSRMHDVGDECCVISQIQPKWMEDINNSYDGDQEVTQVMTQVLVDPVAVTNMTLQNGLLKYKGKLLVGNGT